MLLLPRSTTPLRPSRSQIKNVLLFLAGLVFSILVLRSERSALFTAAVPPSPSSASATTSTTATPLLMDDVLKQQQQQHANHGGGEDKAVVLAKRTILVEVFGEFGKDGHISRHMPMIKRGYHAAFPAGGPATVHFEYTSAATAATYKRPRGKREPDIAMCSSLDTCFGPGDTAPPCTQCQANRIPRLRAVLWSKNAFCETVPAWLASLVSFPCWVLPDSKLEFRDLLGDEGHNVAGGDRKRWIAKPFSSLGGRGIYVVDSERELRDVYRSGKQVLIQPLLSNPMLVKGHKVDMRVYVLVTSTTPLRAYVHRRGLVRFASQEYKSVTEANLTAPDTGDEAHAAALLATQPPTAKRDKKNEASQYLTNTSLNKKASNMTAAELTWSFQHLWEEMGETRAREMRLQIDRSIALILLSAEPKFGKLAPRSIRLRRYQLLGIDVIFSDSQTDEAKVIEVNGEPSFASSEATDDAAAAHYGETKLQVARDVAAVVLAPPLEAAQSVLPDEVHGDYGLYFSELERESRAVGTEFRLIYPTAAGLALPDTGLAQRMERVLRANLLPAVAAPGDNAAADGTRHNELHASIRKRLQLHRFLCQREHERYSAFAAISGNDDEGSYNGRRLVFEDIAADVAAAAAT